MNRWFTILLVFPMLTQLCQHAQYLVMPMKLHAHAQHWLNYEHCTNLVIIVRLCFFIQPLALNFVWKSSNSWWIKYHNACFKALCILLALCSSTSLPRNFTSQSMKPIFKKNLKKSCRKTKGTNKPSSIFKKWSKNFPTTKISKGIRF